MARRPKIGAARAVGLVRRSRRGLLVTTALQATALIALAFPAAAAGPAPNAQPQGGQVVAGKAAISATPTTTTIDQSSARAAINWQNFDIGSAQTVTFNQPSSSSITLNRVISPNPSQIAGHLSANGQLVIVNQSGVVFTGSSQVDVQGLFVSTANLTTHNFMAGHLVFDQAGKPNAAIVNQGNITIKQAGLAALVAPSVANSGVITAKLGTVVLGGATTHTVDLYGDGMMSVALTGKVVQAPLGADGKPVTALVTNTGTIRAAGGSITLTAAAADGIVQDLVRAGGHISTSDATGSGGSIALRGIGGSLTIDGDVTASGKTGGQIEAVATNAVTLAPTARVSASGRQGGGVIALGTTLARAKGGPLVTPTLTAASTVIAPGARVSADATRKGNGGTVTVLSTAQTDMGGTITAKGGPKGGDGGFVEVSGKTGYSLTGTIDVSAPLGAAGTILIDPDVLIIQSNTAGDPDGVFTPDANNGGTVLAGNNGAGTGTSTLDSGVFTGSNFTGNVVLQAGTLLAVNEAISSASLTSLVLQAPTITSTSDGAISLTGNTARLSIAANSLTLAAAISAPTIEIAPLTAGAQTVTGSLAANINASTLLLLGAYTAPGAAAPATTASSLTFDASDVPGGQRLSAGTGTLDLRSSGAITQQNSLALSASTLQIAAGGAVSLPLAGNSFTTLAQSSSTGGLALAATGGSGLSVTGAVTDTASIALSSAVLTVASGGSIAAPNTSLTATTGALTISGVVSGPTSLTLSARNAININTPGSIINTGSLTAVSSNGSVSLIGTGNTIITLGASSAANNFSLTDTTSLTTTGLIKAGSAVTPSSLTLSAPTLTAGGTLTASAVSLTASAGTLAVSGTIGGSLSSIALSASGDITETGSLFGGGVLTATSSGGAVVLTSGNTIATLGSGSAQNGFTFTDSTGFSTTGAVSGSNVSLGANSTLAIGSSVSAGSTGTIALSASGDITESGGSLIGGGTLIAASSGGAVTLNASANALSVLAFGSAASAGGFTFTDGTGFATAGAVSGSNVTLGANGTLAIGSAVSAGSTGTIALSASGDITESGGSLIGGGTLIAASSGGAVTLNSAANTMTVLAFGSAASAGGFTFTDSTGFATAGAISGSNVSLGAGGTLAIGSAVSAGSTGTIALSASGDITESGGSLIGGGTLIAASSGGAVTLNSAANALTVLAFGSAASAGGFTFTDGTGFATAGAVSSGTVAGAGVTLNASSGTLAIGSTVSATATGTIALSGAAGITESGSLIGGGTLTAVSGGGAVTLNGTNSIGTLTASSALNGFAFTDSAGFVTTGTVSGAAVTLTATTGTLDMKGLVSGSGGVAVIAGGTATTGTILVESGGRITVSGSNDLASLSAPTVSVSGTISAPGTGSEITVSTNTLTLAGALAAASGGVAIAPLATNETISVSLGSVSSAGTLGLAAASLSDSQITAQALFLGSLDGSTVTNTASIAIVSGSLTRAGILGLFTGGSITQSGGSLISVGVLIGSAGGDIVLPLSNAISAIGQATPLGIRGQSTAAGLTAGGNATVFSSHALTVLGSIGLEGGLTSQAITSVSLSSSGAISLFGPVGNCGVGSVAVTASGSLTIGNGGTPAVNPLAQGVWSSGTTTIGGAGTISLDAGGGVLGSTVVTTAPLLVNGGTLAAQNNASIGATGALALTVQSGIVAVGTLLISSAIALNGGVLDAGTIAAGTPLTYGPNAWSLSVQAGTVALPATLATGETLISGGSVQFGTGSIAGILGSSAGTAAFNDTGGTLIVGGNVNIFATTVAVGGGLLAAGGTLGITGTSISQTAGEIASPTVRLYATTGAATQGGSATLLGSTVIVQAPSADNDFALTQSATVNVSTLPASFTCICSTGSLSIGVLVETASVAASIVQPISVGVIGNTIHVDKSISAGTLSLAATGTIVETPGTVVINVGTLTGSASSATLGSLIIGATETISNANTIATLGNFVTTAGSLSITASAGLAVQPGATLHAGATGATPASPASITLATGGTLSIPVGATVSATDAAATGNVTLVANSALGGGTGSITIGGVVAANGGTLLLSSETDITATGVLTAHLLTGRAGAVAGDGDLPTNFQAASTGSIALTGATNAIDGLGTLLATGAIRVFDAPTGALTVLGPVVGGYGTASLGDVLVTTTGSLAVNGSVASGAATGNVTLLAGGSLTVGASGTPVIYATGTDILQAGSFGGTGAFTLTGGLINAGAVTIGGFTKTINGGTIVSTGGNGGSGIDLSSGVQSSATETLTFMSGGTISATGASANANVTFYTLSLSGGLVSANGAINANTVTQTAGEMRSVGSIALGALEQSAGAIESGTYLTIGSGSGTAGIAGSSSPNGWFKQTGGTLLAGNDINLWNNGSQLAAGGIITPSTSVALLNGLIAAGGTIGLTADSGISQAGTVSGASGVALLTSGGDARQSSLGLLAGSSILVQAPAGTVSFGNFGGPGTVTGATQANLAALQCGTACAVPLTGSFPGTLVAPPLAIPVSYGAANPAIAEPVALVGGSIDLPGNVLASTLKLYARNNITEDGTATINAGSLTGSAGVPSAWILPADLMALGWTQTLLGWSGTSAGSAALGSIPILKSGAFETAANSNAVVLGNANSIATLGDFAVTQNFSLSDVSALAIGGIVKAGYASAVGTGPAGITIAVAAPITLTGAVLAGVSASIASASAQGGDVVLISNSHLSPGGTPGSLSLAGMLTAYGAGAQGGTLALYSETSITDANGVGLLTANVLTGRAGLLASDTIQLPSNFAVNSPGSVSLTNPANAIDTLDTFLATAGFALQDTPTNAAATLTIVSTNAASPVAAVAAGYGGAASDLFIQVNGGLAVNGWVGASAGNASLSATGNLVVGTGAIQSVIAASNTASLTAGGTLTVTNGLLNAAAITLDAPTKIIGTGTTGSGILVSTGAGSNDGIVFSGGSTTLNLGGTLSATGTVNVHNDITLDTVTQTGATVSANGNISIDVLTLDSGRIIAVNNISIGTLDQSGGAINAGGSITITSGISQGAGSILANTDVVIGQGQGTLQAGIAGSQPVSGSSVTIDGTIISTGNVSLWDATSGAVQISGVVIAGGTVGLTASSGINQSAGTIAGAGGVALLALSGDARQTATDAIVASGSLAGQGIAIQAPDGLENFSSFGRSAYTVSNITPAASWALDCPACLVPVPTSFVAPSIGGVAATVPVVTGGGFAGSIDLTSTTGLVPVALLGGSIDIQAVTLRASTLGLYASGNISEETGGVIVAGILNGSAGLASGSVLPAGVTALGWSSPASLGAAWTSPSVGSAILGSIPTLTGGASETIAGGGTAALTLSNANTIAVLGSFAATQNFSLTDVSALTIGTATATLPFNGGGGTSLALGGTVLAGYSAAPAAGFPASATIAVAAPITVSGAVLAGIAGSADSGNVTLISNSHLAAGGTTGAVTVAGSLAANGGTLALYSQTSITDAAGAGMITASVLTGRAGSLASDTAQLPNNFTVNSVGSVSLTNAANAVATLDTFLATAGFTLADAPPAGTLTIVSTNAATPVAAVTAGYGGIANGTLSIQVAGNLVVDAWLGAQGGNLTLTANGGAITVGSTTIQSVIAATGTAGLVSDTAITLANSMIDAASVALAAPTKTIGTADTPNSGLIVATGGGAADGIALSGGTTTLNGATLSAIGSTANDVALDATTQNDGIVSANGNITAPSLLQNAGTLIAVGNVAIGQGSGQAGIARSQAGSGTVTIGGSIVSGGNVSLWDASGAPVQISGAVLANGTIGLTASDGLNQSAGTIAGAKGVALLALSGDATQAATNAIVASGALAGQGIAIQAPDGLENFSSFGRTAISLGLVTASGAWVIECPACTVPLPSSFTAPSSPMPVAARAAGSIDLTSTTGLVPVALLGGSIDIQAVTLRASTLGLYASGNISEETGGVIVAGILNGSAGLASGSVLPAGVTALGWSSPASLGAAWTSPSVGSAILGSIPTLTGGASETIAGGGTAALTLSNANTIAVLGSFAATQNFSLTDVSALTIGTATATLPFNGGGGTSLALGGTVLAGYSAAPAAGFPASATIAVAAPITVSGAVLAGIAGSADSGNVTLISNSHLAAGGTTGAVTVAGSLAANGGTLALYSQTSITDAAGAGMITASVLTGRAGSLASDTAQLPNNFTVNSVGSVSLTNAANAVATLDTFLATAGFTLADAPPAGTLTIVSTNAATPVAAVTAGYGGIANGTLSIQVAGNLVVDAWLGAQGGNLTLTANGGAITVGSTTIQSVIAATGTAGLVSDTAITLANSMIDAASVALAAPTKTIGTADTPNSGLIVATGGGAADGIALSGGTTTLNGATLSAIGSTANDVALDATTQNDGIVSANGNITAPSLLQNAGTFAAGGSIAIAGMLDQVSGAIVSFGPVTVGSGTGQAGAALSQAGSGAVTLGGSILSGGNVSLWDATSGTVQLSGTVIANGTIGLTANGGLAQNAGLLAGATGVNLLAASGSATQVAASATLAAGTAAAQGILVEAPKGLENFTSFGRDGITVAGTAAGAWSIECPACTVPLPLSFTAPATAIPVVTGGVSGIVDIATATGRVPVTLVGASIDLPANVLASTLALYASGNITEEAGATVTANLLNGRAGVVAADTSEAKYNFAAVTTSGSVSLASPGNAIDTLGGFLATAGFTLVDTPTNVANTLTIASTGSIATVAAGYGGSFGGNLSIQIAGNLIADGWLGAAQGSNGGGNLTLSATGATAGAMTIGSAAQQSVLAAAGTASLRADTTLTIADALINAAGVTLAAPTKTIGTTGVANSGLIVASGGGTSDGIALSGGTTTLNGATLSAAGGTQNDIALDAATQIGGMVSANGAITAASLAQNGGSMIAVGGIAIAGPLAQTSGAIVAGGNLSVGQGSGQAGIALSDASAGAVTIAGTIAAGGNVSLWDASSGISQISGTVLANGTIGLTANNGINQSAGTIAGIGGVALIALSGNATQAAVIGEVASGAFAGQGIAIQAPEGTENFSSFGRTAIRLGQVTASSPWLIECPACLVPLPGAFAAPAAAVPVATAGAATGAIDLTSATGLVPVALLGGAVEIQGVTLRASTLGLYASNSISEDAGGIIAAGVLTGSAGILGNAALPAGVVALGWSSAAQLGAGWTVPNSGSAILGTIPVLTGGGSETASGAGKAAVLLSNANTIATLGSFVTTQNFSLDDTAALSIGKVAGAALPLNGTGVNTLALTGVVQATNGATIAVANSLAVAAGGGIAATTVELMADRWLSAAATTASLTGAVAIGGALSGGKIALYSETSITDAGGTGVLTANVLTGRAGLSTSDTSQLPANFVAVNTLGSVSLVSPLNAIGTLDSFLATGGIALIDTPGNVTRTLTIASIAPGRTAAVDAGYGAVSGGNLSIGVFGNLVVDGWVGAQSGSVAGTGNLALTATNGSMTIGTGTIQSVLGASSTASLHADGALTIVNALIDAAAVRLDAPAKIIGTAGLANSGLVVTTGGGTLDGIVLSGGASTLNGATLSATGNTGNDIVLDAATQAGGIVSANGGITAPSLTQTGGNVVAVGNITLGSGSGTAGMALSGAASGTLTLAGTLVAGGNISLWDASSQAVQLSGSIAAGGTIGLTAQNGIAQTAGSIAGAKGVALLATDGAAAQASGAIVAGGSGGGQGIAIQAPQGVENFAAFGLASGGAVTASGPWTLECPACTIALPASFAAPASTVPVAGGGAVAGAGAVPVTLVGASISLPANVLASTLQLYAKGNIVEAPGVAITAAVLTGSAGVQPTPSLVSGLTALGWTLPGLGWTTPTAGSALLGYDAAIPPSNPAPAQNENAIATLAQFTVTQTLLLHDATALVIGSPNVASPIAVNPTGTTAITFGGNLQAGTPAGGTIDISSDATVTQTGRATWSASRIDVTARGDLTLASGGQLTVATDGPATIPGVYPRPANTKSPFDPSTTTSYGASFTSTTGSIHLQSGVSVTPLTGQTNPLARFILGTTDGLTANSGIIDLTGGLSSPQTLASAATVILYLSNGTGTGSINVGALEVFYTGLSSRPLTNFNNSSLLNAQGQLVQGTAAASLASIGFGLPGTAFKPNPNIRLNSCPIASVNCTILSSEVLPAGSPLRDIIFGVLNDSYDDPDFLLPSVSDQDY